ncbi:MAG: 6-carboxytetrahydropterin synthase [Bacteroidales bacterium]|jgi:6-pyruvoyltetrahydropterin/6-carboxytetrahydropterin synthase|nr:6-carboxytetrahydropterin synthase [Bacteroidales bacterium]
MNVRITKEFTFDMAHALLGYDGLCCNIHGHTYTLQVTLKGHINTNENSPKQGMVVDFGELKKIIKPLVVDAFDHALVLNEKHAQSESFLQIQDQDKLIQVPFQPTCENLVAHFAGIILHALPETVVLHSLRLYETPTSWAEWFAEDNE